MASRYAEPGRFDRDRDDYEYAGRRAAPKIRPRSRSRVRISVPESVVDDDLHDRRHEKSRPHGRDDYQASARPSLRRRRSIDLERKTSRQDEEFRRRRDALEAQEAGMLRKAERYPRVHGRRSEKYDDDDDDDEISDRHDERRRDHRRSRTIDDLSDGDSRRGDHGHRGIQRARTMPVSRDLSSDAVSYGSEPVEHMGDWDHPRHSKARGLESVVDYGHRRRRSRDRDADDFVPSRHDRPRSDRRVVEKDDRHHRYESPRDRGGRRYVDEDKFDGEDTYSGSKGKMRDLGDYEDRSRDGKRRERRSDY